MYQASFSIKPYPLEPALYNIYIISAAQVAWRLFASYIYRRLQAHHIFFIWFVFEPVAMCVITWANIILCSLGGPHPIPGAPYASVTSSIFDPEHQHFVFDVLLCAMELTLMVTCITLHHVLWIEEYDSMRDQLNLPMHYRRENIAKEVFKSWWKTKEDPGQARCDVLLSKITIFLLWSLLAVFAPYHLRSTYRDEFNRNSTHLIN
ncbi:hypothetical protein HA402_007219 [Bradysia odoriphaga]|nr:hypothetical protein HA402_007219 [Bradysia odoriphaga]